MKKIYCLLVILLVFSSISYAGSFYKGVKRMKFANGLTLVTKKDTSVPVVSVNIWVRVGSINETDSQAGLSHFIEHLLFKGSKNYEGDLMTRNVEKMGGLINAATSKEYTCFYIDIQKDGYIEALKMLADTVINPIFPENEIDMERKVVIEEIQRHKDNPQSELFEHFMTCMYKTSDYRRSIIGRQDVIANISRDEIIKYHKTHYIPQKMVVSVVGDINEKETKNIVKELIGKKGNKYVPAEPVIIEQFKKADTLTNRDKTEHSYMLAGFLGPDSSSEDVYIADVALNILGAGKASRLYRKIKEKQNLVFSINASFMTLKGTGSAYISAVFDEQNYSALVDAVNQEIEVFVDEGPTDEELARTKINIKSDWMFEMQTFNEQAGQLGYWYLQGHPEIPSQYIEKINKVTKEDVQNFMKKYYSSDKLSKAVIFSK